MDSFVQLSVPGATGMQCYVARPAQEGKHPGVMLFQEAFGVNGHIRDVADRIAREGYVTYAPELFHRTAPAGFEIRYDDFPSVQPHAAALTEENLSADIRATYEAMLADAGVDGERIGAIGFCMGGRTAFLADLLLPIRAAISFYGSRIADVLAPRAADLHAPVMLAWGGLDQHILPEHIRSVVDALRAAGKEYINAEFSNANHGFFCDARPAYHKDSADIAWLMVKQFFKTHLGN